MAAPVLGPDSKVLVYVGLDLVGDGLIKLPFARALRAAFPQGKITWLAGRGKTAYAGSLSPLVAGLIDEVIEDADIGNHSYELIVPPLRGREFDLVIDTQRRFLTSLILKRIRTRVFVSGSGDFVLSDVKPPESYKKPEPMIRQMLDLIEIATSRATDPYAPLPLPDETRALAAKLLRPGYPYIAIAPGAGGKIKQWPLDNFVGMARTLANIGKVPVFLLGPDEESWFGHLAGVVPTGLFPLQSASARGFNYRADLTIALAQRCQAGIANDSGGGHMIAAAGIPMISLFGPTDPAKFAPSTKRLKIIRAQEFGGSDMALIPPGNVLNAIEELLFTPPAWRSP
jgi:ADP-heptose:LPS heptosyltransferase